MSGALMAAFDGATPLARLVDTEALAIVLGGTVVALVAQCGPGRVLRGIVAAGKLLGPRFDVQANRAELARAVSEFVRRGHLCADRPPPPDPHLARAIEAYRRTGRAEGMRAFADDARERLAKVSADAARPFEQAGELAPVFGLVGTLIAIAGLAAGDPPALEAAIGGALASAVLSTLYGVLAAHLAFIPLARAIERRAAFEESARAELVEWAATHFERAHGGSAARGSAANAPGTTQPARFPASVRDAA